MDCMCSGELIRFELPWHINRLPHVPRTGALSESWAFDAASLHDAMHATRGSARLRRISDSGHQGVGSPDQGSVSFAMNASPQKMSVLPLKMRSNAPTVVGKSDDMVLPAMYSAPLLSRASDEAPSEFAPPR